MCNSYDSVTPASSADSKILSPPDLGRYEIVETLTEDQTLMAIAPGGRRVVLKILEPDLIVRGQLHPSVRDRLARVREIAHLGVANLHGAERDAGRAYLVWEFVEGVPLENWCQATNVSPRDLLLLSRELVLVVEALHARGVVHGAIHGRNVIVGPTGRLKLTHVSPYLYTDAAVDTASVIDVLQDAAARAGHKESPLADAMIASTNAPAGTRLSLRSIGSQITALIESRQVQAPPEAELQADVQLRRRSFLGAVGVGAVGILMAYGIHHYLNGISSAATVPPEAPPAAMKP